MVNIWKYLRSEGGYVSAAMALGSMIMNGVMGSQANKKVAKLSHKTGEETNLQNFLGQWDLTPPTLSQQQQNITNQQQGMAGNMADALNAAKAGGLYPAISEAFSQRPNSAELNSIAAQERQLKNQALNTGARGGLLRQQMFEAGKNAATNKMNVMENARQNALQRAFQIFQPQAPTNAANAALNQQQLGYNTLQEAGLQHLADLGVARNKMELGGATQDAQGAGSGLGSVLGGLGGLLGPLLGGGGSISSAVGGTPTFSLPTSGQGFPSVPWTSLGGGGLTGIM